MLRRALTLLPLLLLPVLAPTPAHAAGEPRGIDVARYQHPNGAVIDWAQLRQSSLSFVYVKATEGTSYVNPYHADDVARSRSAGFAAGSYHFARPALPLSTAVDQANYFLRTIGNQARTRALPPALDLESTGGLSRGDVTAWAQLFLDEIRARTGRTPVVYSYPSFLRTSVYGPALHNARLWIASYNGSVPDPIPGEFPEWDVWQTSASGSYPGIKAAVDTNLFSGTPEELATFADGTLPTAWPNQPATMPYGVALTTRTRGTLTLRWIPANDGGNPVTSWAVSLSDGRTLTLPATGTSAVLSGLDPAVAYRATIHAVTSAGAGADNTSNLIVPLGPTVTTLVPGAATYGGTVTATGRLTSAGAAVAGQAVRLEQRIGSSRTTVATVTTAADGTWRWASRATGNQVLRAVFDQADGYATSSSGEALQRVAPAMDVSAPAQVKAGRTWNVAAALRPAEDRVVRLLVYTSGHWAVVATAHPDARGVVHLAWKNALAGNRTTRLQVGAGPTTSGAVRRIDVRVVR